VEVDLAGFLVFVEDVDIFFHLGVLFHELLAAEFACADHDFTKDVHIATSNEDVLVFLLHFDI